MRNQYTDLQQKYEAITESKGHSFGPGVEKFSPLIQIAMNGNLAPRQRLTEWIHRFIDDMKTINNIPEKEAREAYFYYHAKAKADPSNAPSRGLRRLGVLHEYLMSTFYKYGQEAAIKIYKGKPSNWDLRHDQRVYEGIFRLIYKEFKEDKAIRAAQTQHTATHGVDLSNLEENIDHYPANSSNNFFDVVKNAPDKNQFIDWLINKSNLAHDLQDARDNYMEPEFTASLSKKRANWMIVNVYYDAVLENRQYECEEFSDNPIECIEKEKERIKKEILDYYDQYKAYLAQIKHTGTHGVDLSAL